jgi:hypothetical protein
MKIIDQIWQVGGDALSAPGDAAVYQIISFTPWPRPKFMVGSFRDSIAKCQSSNNVFKLGSAKAGRYSITPAIAIANLLSLRNFVIVFKTKYAKGI